MSIMSRRAPPATPVPRTAASGMASSSTLPAAGLSPQASEAAISGVVAVARKLKRTKEKANTAVSTPRAPSSSVPSRPQRAVSTKLMRGSAQRASSAGPA